MQVSRAASTSYHVPEVLELTGPGSFNASTYGGDIVTIRSRRSVGYTSFILRV